MMSDEIAELRARIARLEARDACRSSFNEYLHYLDGGFTEELLEVFAADARLEVMNFPPGSGKDLEFCGRDEIRPLYADHEGIMSRHHSANVSVVVNEGATRADLSAYFLTALNYGLTGGVYEATLEPRDGKWRLTWMRISSSWGWVVPQENPPFLADHLGAGTLRGGRPVTHAPPRQVGS
jgi:hypothetical protein